MAKKAKRILACIMKSIFSRLRDLILPFEEGRWSFPLVRSHLECWVQVINKEGYKAKKPVQLDIKANMLGCAAC